MILWVLFPAFADRDRIGFSKKFLAKRQLRYFSGFNINNDTGVQSNENSKDKLTTKSYRSVGFNNHWQKIAAAPTTDRSDSIARNPKCEVSLAIIATPNIIDSAKLATETSVDAMRFVLDDDGEILNINKLIYGPQLSKIRLACPLELILCRSLILTIIAKKKRRGLCRERDPLKYTATATVKSAA
uniref:Uncharacterized protein n=1 Tax=Cucumis melo TaxID=3656 RepID=A0A9I9EBK6_CUCME